MIAVPWLRGHAPRPAPAARGFSLVEALVAMLLFGIVITLLTSTLVGGQRIHGGHVQHAAASESGRAALAILSAELRQLSAGDGDLLAMDAGAVTFKAMRGLSVACAPADLTARTIVLDAAAAYGFGPVGAPDDSVFLFADGDPATRRDDSWLGAAVSGMPAAASCPGGSPGVALTLAGVTAAQLSGVRPGAPVRGFRPTTVLAYQDAGGDWWLGQRTFQASTGSWSTVQPVLGPLTPSGLALTYLDSSGGVASSPTAVSRIEVRVGSRSPRRVYRSTGATYLLWDAGTRVVLRNNPRY